MGADMVMTQGATQSNHARQTAAFAAKLGMACHILLEDRTGSNDPNYNGNGNVLLDHLHGATTEKRPGGGDMNAEMEAVADTLPGRGPQGLYDPRRRLEPDGRARLRQLRVRTRGAGERPWPPDRPDRHGDRDRRARRRG